MPCKAWGRHGSVRQRRAPQGRRGQGSTRATGLGEPIGATMHFRRALPSPLSTLLSGYNRAQQERARTFCATSRVTHATMGTSTCARFRRVRSSLRAAALPCARTRTAGRVHKAEGPAGWDVCGCSTRACCSASRPGCTGTCYSRTQAVSPRPRGAPHSPLAPLPPPLPLTPSPLPLTPSSFPQGGTGPPFPPLLPPPSPLPPPCAPHLHARLVVVLLRQVRVGHGVPDVCVDAVADAVQLAEVRGHGGLPADLQGSGRGCTWAHVRACAPASARTCMCAHSPASSTQPITPI